MYCMVGIGYQYQLPITNFYQYFLELVTNTNYQYQFLSTTNYQYQYQFIKELVKIGNDA